MIQNELINNTIETTTKSADKLLFTIEDKQLCKRYIEIAKKCKWEYIENNDKTICGYIPKDSIYFKAIV